MVVPNPVHREVIFVVDGSASLGGVLPSLISEYIQPCLEYFNGGKLSDIPFGLQFGPVQYSLVVINPSATTYRPVCTYFPITCSPTKVLKWMHDLKLEGGLVGNSLLLSEGLSAVMEVSHLMESTRETCLSPDLSIEKHCMLVVNLPPSSHPCVESLRYAGKTYPQLIKLMVENQMQLSVISPCSQPSFKDIFDKTISSGEMDTSALDEADHSLHAGHLVLFKHFQIATIKEKKKTMVPSQSTLGEKVDASEQPNGLSTTLSKTDVPMDTSGPGSVGIKIKEEPGIPLGQSQTNMVTSDVSVKLEPNRSNSPLTFAVSGPGSVKQEPTNDIGALSTTTSMFSQAGPSTTAPSSLDSQIISTAAGMKTLAGQANLQVLPAGVSAGSSSLNPIQISSPSGLQTISDKPFTMAISQLSTSGMGSVSTSLPSNLAVSSMSLQTQAQVGGLGQQGFSLAGAISSMQSGGPAGVGVVSMSAIKSESAPQAPPPYTTNTMPLINQQQVGGATAQVNATFNKDKPFVPAGGSSTQAGAPMNRTTSNGAVSAPSLAATNQQQLALLAGTAGPTGAGQKPQANFEKAMIAAQMAVKMAHASGQVPPASAGVGAAGTPRTGPMPQGNQAQGVKASIIPNVGTGQTQQTGLGMGQNQQQLGSQSGAGVQQGQNRVAMVMAQQTNAQPTQQGNMGNNMMGINKNPVGNVPSSGMPDYQRVPTPPIASSAGINQTQLLPTSSLAPPSSQAQNTFIGQPQQPAQQPIMQPMQVQRPVAIWNGIMELAEMHDNQRQMRQVRCSVLTTRNEIIQELQPQSWPQKMTMNAYPKSMFNSIMLQMDFNKATTNLKTVNFQFQDNPQTVSMLRQLMVNEIKSFAIVHLVGGNMTCPVKALILVWNEKQKQFTGLVPLEQDRFVAVVKQVLIVRQKQQQQWKDQQQQQQQQQQQPQQLGGGGYQQQPAPNTQQQLPLQNQQTMSLAQQQQQHQTVFSQPSSLQMPASSLSTMASQQQTSNVGTVPQQQPQGTNLMGGGVGMVTQQPNQMQHQSFPGQPQHPQQATANQQQAEKQVQLEKILKFLIQSRPEQQEAIFQRLRVTSQEQKQQWLTKANLYKQQLLQQQQQQQQQQQASQANRMMMGGGQQASSGLGVGGPMQQQQQGLQAQRAMGRGIPQVVNQGGLTYNRPQNPRPGVPPQQQQQQQQQQTMGGVPGMRQPNVMPQQQQLPPGYNQWQT